MAKARPDKQAQAAPLVHGAAELSAVTVDDHSSTLRSGDGFLGDDANRKTFNLKLEELRKLMRTGEKDPLGRTPTKELSKKKIDAFLYGDEVAAAAIVMGAVEGFAQDFAGVIGKFLKSRAWTKTEKIAIGGGFRQSRTGELAIARTQILLKASGLNVELAPIAHHPDEAGLIGAVYLMPDWMLNGHEAILAVDIGGTNVRAGIVEFGKGKNRNLDETEVRQSILWRHADDEPSRSATISRLSAMIEELIAEAKEARLELAPLIGIGCPGVIESDGSIVRGGQNLPGGNWESDHFNLPRELKKAIPQIGGDDTFIMMHNDAVVQGLSQMPQMRDVSKWAVLTIGTGLGNAHFTNRMSTKA
jgi:predicted NBD/HSP70 family sugar kinase